MARIKKMDRFKKLRLVKDSRKAKVLLNILNKLKKKVKNYMMHLLKLSFNKKIELTNHH